jgi:hypothetical protein
MQLLVSWIGLFSKANIFVLSQFIAENKSDLKSSSSPLLDQVYYNIKSYILNTGIKSSLDFKISLPQVTRSGVTRPKFEDSFHNFNLVAERIC